MRFNHIVLFIIFWVCTLNLHAQNNNNPETSTDYKNEIGIEVSYFIPILKHSNQSYLLNYKRFDNHNGAWRAGLSLDIFSKKENGRFIDAKFGYERGLPKNKWRLFYGVDLTYSFTQSNRGGFLTNRYGFEPLLGVRYNFTKHFSISTEMKLNVHYYTYYDKASFAPNPKSDEFRYFIGSIGTLIISYHL